MFEQVYSNPDIFKIYVPLPDNPLKNLNCYVLKAENENLIIDTGFNRPECLEALKEGLAELNVDIEKSSLFLTHLHSDHTGLAGEIMNENSTIYMSEIDFNRLQLSSAENSGLLWKIFLQKTAFLLKILKFQEK